MTLSISLRRPCDDSSASSKDFSGILFRASKRKRETSVFGVIENDVLELLGSSFSSRRPTGLHQLGKPLPSSRGDSTLFFGRSRSTHLLTSLQSGPTSSGGRREFSTGRRRHRSSVGFGLYT